MSWRVYSAFVPPSNGLELSREASQGKYRAEGRHPAGRVGSIELLGAEARTSYRV